MIRLTALNLAGFRGIRDPIAINFSAGFTVLTGANGSGKSSILDAIEYALAGNISKYEEGSGEKGEKSSAYVWWRGSRPAPDRYVQLQFVDETGRLTTVTRRPESVTVENGPALLELLCDTSLNPESSIEELCRTSIIRDEFIAKHSVDLPETDRFAFVRAAVGTETTSAAEAKLMQTSKLAKRRTEETQREYDRVRGQVQDQVEQLATARAQQPEQDAAKEAEARLRIALGLSNSTMADLLASAGEEVKYLQSTVTTLDTLSSRGVLVRERQARLQSTGTVERTLTLERNVEELRARYATADQVLTARSAELRTAQSAQAFMSNLAQLLRAGSAIGRRSETCPLCGSQVSESSFRSHVEEVRAEVEQHGQQVAAAVTKEQEAGALERQLRTQLEAAVFAYEKVRAEIDAVDKQVEAFAEEVAQVGLVQSGLSVETLPYQQQAAKERLAFLERDRRSLFGSNQAGRIRDIEKDLEVVRAASLAAERQVAKARRLEEQLKEASATLKRIGAEAVEERLAAIRPLFTELYLRLRPHTDWKTVSYAVRGDVRRFLSLRVDEDLNLKFLFSSGQRRATGLAFLISVALSRPWCKFKTLVLDDPIQHVDDFRAVHLVETLAAIRTMKYQLICAVEDPALADLMTRRLRSSFDEAGTIIRMRYASGDGAQVEDIREIAPLEALILARAS